MGFASNKNDTGKGGEIVAHGWARMSFSHVPSFHEEERNSRRAIQESPSKFHFIQI